MTGFSVLITLTMLSMLLFARRIAYAGESDASAVRRRSSIRHEDIQPRVLAFYYPWYGTQTFTGKWRHYNDIDTESKTIGSSSHYPAIGPYDSHDPEAVAYHVELAERAGIDGFIVSWWGKGDFSDEAMPVILDESQKKGREVTIYYEQVPEQKPDQAVDEFVYILDKYGSHPAYQKVHEKPVIFVYGRALGQLDIVTWASVIAETERRYTPGLMAIADRLDRPAARIFDGIHTYNFAGAAAGRSPGSVTQMMRRRYSEAVKAAEEFKRISCLTIIPGYDDTRVRTPGLVVERHDGKLYQQMWEMVTALAPHSVLITSFNEWHEGSEIEPSTEYGEKYIELTREWSDKFENTSSSS